MFFIKKVIKLILNSFVGVVASIVQSDKVAICGGWFGKRFADNSKAMYLFLNENKEKLNLKHVVFITKDSTVYNQLSKRGFKVEYSNSIQGIWYQLRAKYHFVDQSSCDINGICSSSAIRVNLWHGFPLKKIGHFINDSIHNLNEAIQQNKSNLQIGNWNDFYNVVLSEKHSQLQQYAFGLEKSRMLVGAYPRTLYMLGKIKKVLFDTDQEVVNKLLEIKASNKKIIGYFPTFRDNKEQNLKCTECIEYLDAFASKNNCIVLTKMHLASNVESDSSKLNSTINLHAQSDVYDYLEYLDLMITDYSSISFDYVLMNKPLIYYAFDLDYYKNSDRGFLFEYEQMCAGKIVENIHDIDQVLEFIIQNESEYLNEYKEKFESVKNVVYKDTNPSQDNLFELWKLIHTL